VNLSFFLSLATFRMRSSACDTLVRLCVRFVLCWPAFPLVPALRSTGSAAYGSPAVASAAGCSALFAGFIATRLKTAPASRQLKSGDFAREEQPRNHPRVTGIVSALQHHPRVTGIVSALQRPPGQVVPCKSTAQPGLHLGARK
jgi:hypothetical protein